MADTPETAPQPDPIAATPAPEPAVVADAPAVETPVAETPAVQAEPTLLEQATTKPAEEPAAPEPAAGDKPAEEVKAAADKPVEAAKPEGDKPVEAAAEKPAEAAAAEPAAPEPIEYKYELPETLVMTDEMRAEAHSAFDAFRANPANPQPLIDYHNKAMQAHDNKLREEQWAVFNDTRKSWRTAVMSDEMIGGAGHETAMKVIAQVRDRFASSHKPGTPEYEAELQGFDGMLRATGVGDHPEFLRFLHRVGQVYAEPHLPGASPNPSPSNGRKPGSRAEMLYTNSPSMKRN